MIKVGRRIRIPGVQPEQVFALLSEQTVSGNLLPRVRQVELSERDNEARRAKLVTHMSMGGIFGTIRCEGELTWLDNREINFLVRTPLPVDTRWTLLPATDGTDLQASMGLDLQPLLGPMAAFVPEKQVSEMLISELEAALRAVARHALEQGSRRAAA
jgi:hypothetical protein